MTSGELDFFTVGPEEMFYSAFITGSGSGIGRNLALVMAKRLPLSAITLIDQHMEGLDETKKLIHESISGLTISCHVLDVTDEEKQEAAMEAHAARNGDTRIIWILNAGIGERGDFLDPGNNQWKKTLDVDYIAVATGIRSAVRAMGGVTPSLLNSDPSAGQTVSVKYQRGVIMVVASASGIYPLPSAPIYSSSKAGATMLVRTVAERLSRSGIKTVALCPQFVDTPLVTEVIKRGERAAKSLMGSLVNHSLIKAEHLAEIAIDQLILDQNPVTKELNEAGKVLFVSQQGKTIRVDDSAQSKARWTPSLKQSSDQELAHYAAWAQKDWPESYKKIQVVKLSSDFCEATSIITAKLPSLSSPLPPGTLLVRRVGVGINASDINRTSGRYHGSIKKAEAELPFDCGFEAVSVVVSVSEDLKKTFRVGQAVASMTYDGFAEYACLDAKLALTIPRPSIEIIPLLTSGLTASIALSPEVLGSNKLGPGKIVLVTAAAGGTGQFAVQLAKLAGCHVIATCGGASKANMLKSLSADRIIDYKSESIKAVLKAEYPKGIDVVYESIGGETFAAALDCLADKGSLIVIGMMGEYAAGWSPSMHPGLAEKLLWKSASCIGFFLLKYTSLFRPHLNSLISLMDAGKVKVAIDERSSSFQGVESVAEAVSLLQSGRSQGKVVVQLTPPPPSFVPSKM